MTKDDLINDIINEITFSGMLGLSLNRKEIGRIIHNAALYFYDNWRHSIQHAYLVLPVEIFKNPTFSKTRNIQLPDCIQFVTEVKEIKSSSIFATIDRDFSETKFIGSEIFLTPFMGESLVYRTAVFSFLDLTKNLILETVAYDWNKNNKLLHIKGRTPRVNTIAEIYKKIEEETLYDDELFQRYVRAKAKIRFSNMMSSYGKFQLPGNNTIDFSNIKEEGNSELKDAIDMITNQETPDFIFVERY